MRLELSFGLQKRLDQIKDKAEYWPGKGYAKTIAYLVRHYEESEKIEELQIEFKKAMALVPDVIKEMIENCFSEAIANVIITGLSYKNKTKSEGPGSRSAAAKVRK